MELQAKDLRIGNYTEYNIIDEDRDEWIFNEVELSDLGDVSYLRPIPITEKWLFDLGFDLDGEQINGKYYIKQFAINSGYIDYISIIDKGAGYMFRITSNYDKNVVLPFHYEYIHQLQNLYFALTETDLKLKIK